jgi:hypothetical protein
MSYEDALKLVKAQYPYFDGDTNVKDLPSLKKKLQDWADGIAGKGNAKDAKDFLNQIGDSEQAPSPVLHLPSIVKEIAAVHGMNPHNINSHGKKLIDMDQQTLADTIKGYATSNAIDDEKKAKYQAIYDKYFGKGQVQFSDSTPALAKFVPNTFNQEYKKVFPNATFQAGNELAAKSQMEYLLKTDISGGKGKAAEVQALYDKYWGTGQHSEPATSGGFDADQAKKDWLDIFSGDAFGYDSNMGSPEKAKAYAEGVAKSYQGEKGKQVQKWLDKHFPSGGSSDGYDGPTLAWVKKHYPGTSLAKGNDEDTIKAWWQHGQASSVGNAWLSDLYNDKAHFQGGSPGGFTAVPGGPMPTPEQMAAIGIDSDLAASIAKDPGSFWQSWQQIKKTQDQLGDKWDAPGNYPPSHAWNKIMTAWGGWKGKDAPAPKPPPVYDPAKFAEEYNAIVPGSGSSVATGTASAEKALNKITQLINDHPGTPATDKLIELKNKWFPAGTPGGSGGPTPSPTPSGGTEDYPPPEWIKKHYHLNWTPETVKKSFDQNPHGDLTMAWKDDLHGDKGEFLSKAEVHSLTPQTSLEEPEEDEGVSAPFKSEKATKSDVVNWQSAKPADAADWKSFANWWGKTKLSPAQESAIYHSWFPNKAVTPEQAGSWFKKVYDFHSKPGSGDLGQPDMPAWATSTWAFGSKAAKEWPTFKVWANSSPGLPENLSIKQKLAVWNNLSAGDKKEIEDNYVPKKPVDTKAVVTALQKAYPESDWSTWATMPQGTLKNNVEVLAKQGYKGAIPVFNSVFGGKVPMPPDDDKDEEAPKALPQAPQVPPDKLPGWWKDNYGSTPDQAQKFSGLAHFMKLMGPQYAKAAETGEPPVEPDGSAPKSMYAFQQAWNNTPPAIQAQIGAMNTKVPWKDLEGYKEWLTHQDTPLSDIQKIKPELFGEGGGYNPYSYSFQGMPAAYKWLKQAKAMGQIIEKEPDLKIKGALLQSYHKHFGQKPTLSQSLASIMPKPPPELKSSSWDAFLQSHTTDQINASIKKMMKAEKDPERFVQLVDTWGKYLGGLSGIGAVTNMLGKGWQAGQPVPSKTLLQLYHWKKQGGPASSPVPDYWSIKDQEASPYIKNKQVIGDDSGYYAPYVGWTPPVAGSTGKADPAMMGSLGEPTYTAPEKATTKAYKELIDKVSGHQAAFSGPEKKTMASDEFQTWFNAQSSAYKKTFAHNPGIALDDYNAFMGGEVTSAEPPEGDGAAKFDLNPYHYAPKATGPNHVLMNPQGLKYKVPTPAGHPKYPGWTKNPIPSNGRPHVDWPDAPEPVSQYEDPDTGQKYEIPQEEIPLPGGQHFEAPKQMHELHRGIRIRLDRDRIKRDNMLRPITDKNGQYQKDHDPLLEEIARIVHGSSDTTYPKEYGDLYNELGKHIQDKSGYVPESEIKKQPWGGGSPGGYAEPKKVFDFGQWMMKHHPPPEQLYELAKKWGIDHPEQYGVPPPGETPGSYTAPGLGNKLLDYLESSGYEETGHSPERYVPGFGNHWTQSTGTATSFGGGSTSYNELPVMITADWNGVGEDPNRTGTGNASGSLSAVSHPGETEITLAPGAPVKVKQVRIRPHVPVPQGKPWQASKLRNMAMYLFPHESSDFRNKWAADMEKDDAAHWYDQVVPWLKKNADWDNWVQNAPSGDWIEIPVDPHMREASLSAYERRIMALFEGIS